MNDQVVKVASSVNLTTRNSATSSRIWLLALLALIVTTILGVYYSFQAYRG